MFKKIKSLGIGGFAARLRGTRKDKDDDGCDGAEIPGLTPLEGEKPQKKKVQRRKPRNKLTEIYPSYLQV